MGLKEKLYEKIGNVIDASSDIDSLALAAGALSKLTEADKTIDDARYVIGAAGSIGFGVATMTDYEALQAGMTKMQGTDDVLSDSYGNFLDATGSVMVWVPKFYFKWDGNTLSISSSPLLGYALHRAFIDGGIEKSGFFFDKYQGGNVNGILVSRRGLDPVSTSSTHNPIASINGCRGVGNYYKTAYYAVKSRGSSYHVPSLFQYNALALLAYAHGVASLSTSVCAYKDIAPYLPKGCNNNALGDANDLSVIYTPSGYSNCALTGSGAPFAKTTHNGQNSGIADINGNMWEIASGLTKSQQTDGNFLILKESVSLKNFIACTDISAATATDALYVGNYDTIDLSDVIPSAEVGYLRLGDGLNQVFGFSTDRASKAYRTGCAGIPNSSGISSSGTTAFGQDGFYRYWRTNLIPLVGGSWYASSNAGSSALDLSFVASFSHHGAGLRASKFV